MASLVVTRIKHELDKNHRISEKDAIILFATIKAQEDRIIELEREVLRVKVEKQTEAQS